MSRHSLFIFKAAIFWTPSLSLLLHINPVTPFSMSYSFIPPDVLIHLFCSHSICPSFFFFVLFLTIFLSPSYSFFSFHLAVSLPVPQYNLNSEHSRDPYTEYNTWNPCQLRNLIPSTPPLLVLQLFLFPAAFNSLFSSYCLRRCAPVFI